MVVAGAAHCVAQHEERLQVEIVLTADPPIGLGQASQFRSQK